MRKSMMIALGAIVATALAVSTAHADVLGPGGSETVPNPTFGPVVYTQVGGTVVASHVNEAPVVAVGISGTLTTEVIREAGGTLDFLYQITAAAANTTQIHRVTAVNFAPASITTNVQFGTVVPPPAGLASFSAVTGPVMFSADRSPDASTIGWTFTNGTSGGLAAGLESYVLIVKTNAIFFKDGSTFGLDGGIASWDSFAPQFNSVPEPSTMALAGLGALGLIGYGLRRKARAA